MNPSANADIEDPKVLLPSLVVSCDNGVAFQALCGAFSTYMLLAQAEGVKNRTSRKELAAMLQKSFVHSSDIAQSHKHQELLERVEKETAESLRRGAQPDASVAKHWILLLQKNLIRTGFAQCTSEDDQDVFDKLRGIRFLPGQLDRLCHFDHVTLSFQVSPGWRGRLRSTIVYADATSPPTTEALFSVTITIGTTASGESFKPHIYLHTPSMDTEDFELQVDQFQLDTMSAYFEDFTDLPSLRVMNILSPKSAEVCDTLRSSGIYVIPKMANSISREMELIIRRFTALLKVNTDTLINFREGSILHEDIDLLVFGGKIGDNEDSPVLRNAHKESFQKELVVKAWKKLGDFAIENADEIAKDKVEELEIQNTSFVDALNRYGFNGDVWRKKLDQSALDDAWKVMTNPYAKVEDLKTHEETSLAFEDHEDLKMRRETSLDFEDREKKALAVMEERRNKDLRVKDLDCLIRWKLRSTPHCLKSKEEKVKKWNEIENLPAPAYKRWTEQDESQFLDLLNQVTVSLKHAEIVP